MNMPAGKRRIIHCPGQRLLQLALLIATIALPAASFGIEEIPAEVSRCRKLVESGEGSSSYILEIAPKRFKSWKQMSAQEDANALYLLGRCYTLGAVAVKPDLDKALDCLTRSAAKGHLLAMHSLGVWHRNGTNGKVDLPESEKWFRATAEKGLSAAQYEMGLIYSSGRGREVDNKEAVTWFKSAAEQGHVEAKYGLGRLLYFGAPDVPKERNTGLKLFQDAALSRLPSARARLAALAFYANEASLSKEKCAKQLLESVKEGTEDPWVHLIMARLHADMLLRGIDPRLKSIFNTHSDEQEMEVTRKHGIVAGNGGYPLGYYLAGRAAIGLGKYDHAIELLEKAAEKGNARSMIALSVLANLGVGKGSGWWASRSWYKKAEQAGLDDAKQEYEAQKKWIAKIVQNNEAEKERVAGIQPLTTPEHSSPSGFPVNPYTEMPKVYPTLNSDEIEEIYGPNSR